MDGCNAVDALAWIGEGGWSATYGAAGVNPASCDDVTGGGGGKYAMVRCENQRCIIGFCDSSYLIVAPLRREKMEMMMGNLSSP
jgi:hypothetical protein